MQTETICDIPPFVAGCLPDRVRDEICRCAARAGRVEELRLHRARRATLTAAGGENVFLPVVLTETELEEVLDRMCGHSLYAHRDTIAEGYLSLRDGIRVGVCGRACVTNGRVTDVCGVSTLAVRIPHPSPPCGAELVRLLEQMEFTRGILIYSPPGVGKTTLLRSLAVLLASGPRARRVAVVDTRGELAWSLTSPSLCLDLLSGYPKAAGIETAARTLGAQVILCDEIGGAEEAGAICGAHNCGVPLIATAHASGVRELLGRSGFALLHFSGSFGAYVGLRRAPGGRGFTYDVRMREDADTEFAGVGVRPRGLSDYAADL